jgi:hypothetical protein
VLQPPYQETLLISLDLEIEDLYRFMISSLPQSWLVQALAQIPNDPFRLNALRTIGSHPDFPQEYSGSAAPSRASEQPIGILTLSHHLLVAGANPS